MLEEDDGVVHPDARLVGELERVHRWALQGLHQVGCQCHQLMRSLGCGVFGTGTTQDAFISKAMIRDTTGGVKQIAQR